MNSPKNSHKKVSFIKSPSSSKTLKLPIINKCKSTNDIFSVKKNITNTPKTRATNYSIKLKSRSKSGSTDKRNSSLIKKPSTLPEIIKESKQIVRDAKLFYRKMVLSKKKKKSPKNSFRKLYEHYLDIDASPFKEVVTDDAPEEINEEKEMKEKEQYIQKMIELLKYIDETPSNQLDEILFETAPVINGKESIKLMEKLRKKRQKRQDKAMMMRSKINERKKLINIYKLNPDYCDRQKQIKRNDEIAKDENFKLGDYQDMLIEFVGLNARRELLTDLRRNMDKIYSLSNDVFIDNFVKPKTNWDYFIEEIEGTCPKSLLDKLRSFSKSQVCESLKRKREEMNKRELEERKGFLNQVREEKLAKEKAEKLKKKMNMLKEGNKI